MRVGTCLQPNQCIVVPYFPSVDRAAISVAILPMSEEFHWSDSTKGAINRYTMPLPLRPPDGG
jgi:hypothetical protein